jgi:hypothetical protein
MPHLPRCGVPLTIATFESSLASHGAGCDLRRLRFIDAYGLVATARALRAAEDADILLPTAANMRSHLSGMGFRDFLSGLGKAAGLPATLTAFAPDVVVPLRSTSDDGGAQALSNLLWEQLSHHVAPQVLNAIAEGIWEMVEPRARALGDGCADHGTGVPGSSRDAARPR